MKILQQLRDECRADDMQALLASIPYAPFLGMQVERKGNELTTILPFKDSLVVNVNLPAIHGGCHWRVS